MHPAHSSSVAEAPLALGTVRPDWLEAGPEPAPQRTALPIIAAEVHGPDEINVGGVAAYSVVVANLGEVTVDQVQVKVHLPPGAQPTQLHPFPDSHDDDTLLFAVGRLAPKSRRKIHVELAPLDRGVLELQAEAFFCVTAQTQTKVCQPELALSVKGPPAVVLGDTATFQVIVENRGDGPAENVSVSQRTSDDPHALTGAAHVGRLAPGQSREIYLSVMAQEAGLFRAQFLATAWGELHAEAETTVRVARPMLSLEADGPRVCGVQSPEVFTVSVANPGDAPASNIEAVAAIPACLQVVAFDRPVQFDAARRLVRWRIPQLQAGVCETLRIKASAVQPERFALQVAVAGDYGLRSETQHVCEATGRRVA
jgi:uncharacterized repeat protein (TIGR01451 family)